MLVPRGGRKYQVTVADRNICEPKGRPRLCSAEIPDQVPSPRRASHVTLALGRLHRLPRNIRLGVPGRSVDPASSPVPKDHCVSLSMRPLRGLVARSSACGPELTAPDRPLLVPASHQAPGAASPGTRRDLAQAGVAARQRGTTPDAANSAMRPRTPRKIGRYGRQRWQYESVSPSLQFSRKGRLSA